MVVAHTSDGKLDTLIVAAFCISLSTVQKVIRTHRNPPQRAPQVLASFPTLTPRHWSSLDSNPIAALCSTARKVTHQAQNLWFGFGLDPRLLVLPLPRSLESRIPWLALGMHLDEAQKKADPEGGGRPRHWGSPSQSVYPTRAEPHREEYAAMRRGSNEGKIPRRHRGRYPTNFRGKLCNS